MVYTYSTRRYSHLWARQTGVHSYWNIKCIYTQRIIYIFCKYLLLYVCTVCTHKPVDKHLGSEADIPTGYETYYLPWNLHIYCEIKCIPSPQLTLVLKYVRIILYENPPAKILAVWIRVFALSKVDGIWGKIPPQIRKVAQMGGRVRGGGGLNSAKILPQRFRHISQRSQQFRPGLQEVLLPTLSMWRLHCSSTKMVLAAVG